MIYYLTGEVILWPNSIRIPSDFIVCNGQLVSRARYLDLFERIGYQYGGAGDEFAVPNIVAPTAANATSDTNRLTYLIAVNGFRGRNATFTNASGVVADIRFLAGPAQVMEGARLATGNLLSIEGNEVLFPVVGTAYGGDGETNFNLPNVPPLASQNGPSIPSYIVIAGFSPVPITDSPYSNSLGESLVSEIRLSAAKFNPAGVLPTARGGSLSVPHNVALYSLLGHEYGGKGLIRFSIPKLSDYANLPYYIVLAGIFPPFD